LSSQAHVPDVEGAWFELVQNVSCFIFSRFRSNLTCAILGKSDVFFFDGPSTGYNRGHHSCCSRGLEIQVEGEMLALKGIIIVWLSDIIHHSWICI